MVLNDVLLSTLLFLLIVLAIVLIVFIIKMLYTMQKVDIILEDVSKKLNSVNGLFEAVDKVSESISNFGNTLAGKLALISSKLFGRFRKKKEEDYYEEY